MFHLYAVHALFFRVKMVGWALACKFCDRPTVLKILVRSQNFGRTKLLFDSETGRSVNKNWSDKVNNRTFHFSRERTDREPHIIYYSCTMYSTAVKLLLLLSVITKVIRIICTAVKLVIISWYFVNCKWEYEYMKHLTRLSSRGWGPRHLNDEYLTTHQAIISAPGRPI